MTYWAASEIVMAKDKSTRTKNIIKFIKVASHCWKLRNFNSLFEILGALSLFIVKSLDAAWPDVPRKYITRFQSLLQIMDPKGSFALYRKSLKAAPRAIPWVGVDLKDLTFIEEGNDNFIGAKELINYEKLLMVGGVLSRFARYQESSPYSFEVAEHRDYFSKLISIDQEELEHQAELAKMADRNVKSVKKESNKTPDKTSNLNGQIASRPESQINESRFVSDDSETDSLEEWINPSDQSSVAQHTPSGSGTTTPKEGFEENISKNEEG